MGRLCLLGLTTLMVLTMYGVALWSSQPAQPSSSSLSKEEVKAAPSGSALQQHQQKAAQIVRDVALTSCTYEKEETEAVDAKTVQELQLAFQKLGFTLTTCKASGCVQVPRLELSSLPQDFKSLTSSLKKDLFLRSHLPLILKANEEILQERARLKEIIRQGGKDSMILSSQDKAWVRLMMEKYRLRKWDLDELLVRIDVLPPSLALGQSAVESGWGTSFAARVKNSTFGMTVRNKVLGYSSLQDCVDAYIRNINANPAYRELRAIRARLRAQGTDVCSMALTEGLVRYSELGRQYIKKVQVIIKSNKLKRFDTAQLMATSSDVLVSEKA